MDNVLQKNFPRSHDKLIAMDRNTNDLKVIVNEIKLFAENKYKGITSSQLRNLYGLAIEMRKKAGSNFSSFQMLRPKFAYQSARNTKSEAKEIISVLDALINEMSKAEDIKGFMMFFESLVAYHKYYESTKK